MEWTEVDDATLRQLLKERKSAKQIGDLLGRSKNSIIGRCHRLGLSKKSKATRTRARARQPQPHGQTLLRQASSTKKSTVKPPQPYIERKAPKVGTTCTLLELTNQSCRFPFGDPRSPDFRFCGGPANYPQTPYCDLHMRLAFSKGGS